MPVWRQNENTTAHNLFYYYYFQKLNTNDHKLAESLIHNIYSYNFGEQGLLWFVLRYFRIEFIQIIGTGEAWMRWTKNNWQL